MTESKTKIPLTYNGYSSKNGVISLVLIKTVLCEDDGKM